MLTSAEQSQVRNAVRDGLDRAESNWSKVGDELLKKALAADEAVLESFSEKSKIPGHPLVVDGRPCVAEFIAVVVDMRNSSEHLKSKISNSKIQHGFQRVYYETSALLTAIDISISIKNGVVTEYLGDGALALFPVNEHERAASVRAAFLAAENCVGDARGIVNQELKNRFDLPDIHVGAGLSLSKAMVTLVGSANNLQAKAIGECVWEATKLSGGTNIVVVSQGLKSAWPTEKGGVLRFVKRDIRGIEGFAVKREKD